eukprot:760853-Hanusia_phi.AAC.8
MLPQKQDFTQEELLEMKQKKLTPSSYKFSKMYPTIRTAPVAHSPCRYPGLLDINSSEAEAFLPDSSDDDDPNRQYNMAADDGPDSSSSSAQAPPSSRE